VTNLTELSYNSAMRKVESRPSIVSVKSGLLNRTRPLRSCVGSSILMSGQSSLPAHGGLVFTLRSALMHAVTNTSEHTLEIAPHQNLTVALALYFQLVLSK
jgi:hypothetical protein